MHVLYVLGQDTGGLPHYTAELANAVVDHADVTVFKPTTTSADEVFDPRIDVREVFEPLGISMPRIARREFDLREVARGIASFRRIDRIRSVDPDVVHDTSDLFPQVKLFAKLTRSDTAAPVVVTRHEVERRRFSFARPVHLAENVVDAVIPDIDIAHTVVHSAKQKRALIDRGTSAEAVSVIPHGAYTVFGDHTDVDHDPDPNTVLFFGNVGKHKGVDTLVRAIPRVAAAVPDVTLIIAGDGKVPDEVADVIAANPDNFERHDRFIPNEEVKGFFARAQLAVMPHHEREGGTNGHSGALATAISFATPVVTSRAGEFPEMVDGEGIGRTVPSGDPDRLAAAIIEVLSDPAARREMAANARRLATELSWSSIARKHLRLYENVTRTRTGTRVDPPSIGTEK